MHFTIFSQLDAQDRGLALRPEKFSLSAHLLNSIASSQLNNLLSCLLVEVATITTQRNGLAIFLIPQGVEQ